MASMSKGPSDSAVKVAESAHAERKTALTKAQDGLKAAAEALAVAQATLKVMDYWNVAFSPYGIPNMVLREALAPLNAEARRISTTMTGGTIEVVYSTTRELASGMEKAQLNIEVNNLLGSQDLAGSSKGECGLTNFIISETLCNVGQVARRVGYRWYDEVVPHQDPKVCHAIYSYLSEIAQKLGILIFMVDHNPLVANYADHFLVVEKKGTPNNVVGSIYWRD
jgi:DNA repair exonuclease SbcCD ATPase subunit